MKMMKQPEVDNHKLMYHPEGVVECLEKEIVILFMF